MKPGRLRYILFTAANMLSDGSELLLFIPQAPARAAGHIVLDFVAVAVLGGCIECRYLNDIWGWKMSSCVEL